MIVVKGELLTNALKAKVWINNGYINELIRSNNVSVVAFAFGDDGKYWGGAEEHCFVFAVDLVNKKVYC